MTDSRIEILKQLLEKDPEDSFARYALALEYRSIGESDRAINCLKEVLERDPKYVSAYHQLGQIYAKSNRTGDAKKIYRKGIEMAESIGDAHTQTEMTEELEELEDEW